MVEGRRVDLRVSTMPGRHGEKVVIRIIDSQGAIVSSERLGMNAELREEWASLLESPNGIVLVTGPTGSGKSTTLYSALRELAQPEVNVCTIEDPIEVVESAFNQM